MTFLDRAAARTRQRLERNKEALPEAALAETCARCAPPPPFRTAIARRPGEGIKVIAEVKRSSPSRGPIRPGLVLEDLVEAYERGGASAVSVLTEPEFFGGSLDDIARARAVTGLPILRKDFILDPYQLLEARAAGASAVLLIVALLARSELEKLLAEAQGLGLEALVEVRDEVEIEAALQAGAGVIGINNRDLKTLAVGLETTRKLAPLVPPSRVLVSESGYSRPEQTREALGLGVDAVLVGEALVGCDIPERTLAALKGDGYGLD